MRLARRGNVVTVKPVPRHVLSGFAETPASLADLRADELFTAMGICEQNPLELLVPGNASRIWKNAGATCMRTTLLSVALPDNSFLELGAGTGPDAARWSSNTKVFICAPPLEIIYVAQVAKATQKNDFRAFLRVLEFVDECCGTYARDPFDPAVGEVSYDERKYPTNLVTPSDVCAYLRLACGIDGLTLARKAARQAIDGSGSPMETYINHALTLPPKYAGLSLRKPIANRQLVLDGVRHVDLKHQTLRPDLQWPEFKTLAEYLGDKEHASKSARIEDKNRMQDYAKTPYTVFPLMYDDVKNATALNRTALMLGREFAKHGAKNVPSRLKKLMADQAFLANQRVLMSVLLPPVNRYGE